MEQQNLPLTKAEKKAKKKKKRGTWGAAKYDLKNRTFMDSDTLDGESSSSGTDDDEKPANKSIFDQEYPNIVISQLNTPEGEKDAVKKGINHVNQVKC